MTTPDDVYAALRDRFGEDAVKVNLSAMGVVWVDGDGLYSYPCVIHGRNPLALANPAALAVLCEVGEAMLYDDEWLIDRLYNGDWRVTLFAAIPTKRVQAVTKPAAIVAACGAKQ